MTANDGREALDICQSMKSPIHLLLTDIVMPRLDGISLAEKARALRSSFTGVCETL